MKTCALDVSRTYLAPIGSGLGDVIVCRPILDWLIANCSGPVYLVARGPRQVGTSDLFPGLAGEVCELELPRLLQPSDQYINLRDHPLQRHEDWFSEEFKCKYPNHTIVDILAHIAMDAGILANCGEIKPFEFDVDPRAAGRVILIPGATWRDKCLIPETWDAIRMGLEQRGLKLLTLGVPSKCDEVVRLIESGVPFIPTPDLTTAVNLISSCSCVISVDTGLMHMAVQQGVKTIAIYGVCELYFRQTANCVPIFACRTCVSHGSRVTTEHDFPAHYDSWDWNPPGAKACDYLAFNDAGYVIDLTLKLLQSAAS